MRQLGDWWNGIVDSSWTTPPRVVEATMLFLALIVLGVWWIRQEWQYLVLTLSYILGAIASILARETVAPSIHACTVRLAALISLVALLSSAGVYAVRVLHVI
ncbi:hypothetical protein OsccyDRAFT_2691 [Leptolyngbyaceae cyanobacterium JSC-12]|nr:hypothetical protein OsccyDRAFT_2691 [Leptolyngbyaceae cyanobacterium JSC-12]